MTKGCGVFVCHCDRPVGLALGIGWHCSGCRSHHKLTVERCPDRPRFRRPQTYYRVATIIAAADLRP